MLYERTCGHENDLPPASGPVDAWTIDWPDCHRRAARGVTEAGREVAVLLPLGTSLRDGDVLRDDASGRLVVRVRPIVVWRIELASLREMGLIAAELGNLHAPIEFAGDALLTLPDGPTLRLLRTVGVTWTSIVRPFQPTRSLALPTIAVSGNPPVPGTRRSW